MIPSILFYEVFVVELFRPTTPCFQTRLTPLKRRAPTVGFRGTLVLLHSSAWTGVYMWQDLGYM